MLPEYDLGMKNMGRHVSIWALVEKNKKLKSLSRILATKATLS